MNRIAAYLARSEKAVLSGRDVPDIMPLLSRLKFSTPTAAVSGTAQAVGGALPLTAGAPGNGSYDWANQDARQFGLTLSSTYRDPAHNRSVGGSPTSRHMVKGAAADFSGSPAAMRAFAEAAIKSGKYREVFYDPIGYYWDEGRLVKGSIGGHSDHVHVSAF
jgi:hypothetical protein